jgi:NAD(P)-dependent dehydrogenase (short-subunit alcohol dehydrogenase family)
MSSGEKLAGRMILVAGGGGEIGGAIARHCAIEGASVAVCDLSYENAAAVSSSINALGGKAAPFQLDVQSQESCRNVCLSAASSLGGLTDLVNTAAAVTPDGKAEDLDLDAWRRALDVNFTGVFLMCKHALPFIRAASGGAIVNIASSFAHIALPRRSAYCSTKAALIHFTRVLAVDYGPENIRANTISPGPIDTTRSLRRYGTREKANAIRGRGQALGRTGSVDEVAAAAVFLLSSDASFITGADIRVDGGQTIFKGDSLETSL